MSLKKLIKIFCDIDDFMQEFEELYKEKLLENKSKSSNLNYKYCNIFLYDCIIKERICK